MSGTASRIQHFHRFDIRDFQFCLFRYRFGRFDQILPAFFQITIRVIIQINAPDRVLYHIFHDPIRRKDLCRCRNILCFRFLFVLESGKHLVFLFRDIELVKPTDQFRLPVVFIRDKIRMIQQINKTAFRQDIGRQQ